MVGPPGVTAKGLPAACSLAARDGTQDCDLALRGELGLQESSGQAREKPFCPQPHPSPRALHLQGPRPGSPHPSAHLDTFLAWEWGHGPSIHCPVAPGGTDVQHAGGGGLCEVPPVGAGPVPPAWAPLENLQPVCGEVCCPVYPSR